MRETTPKRKVSPNSVKVYNEEIKGAKEESQDKIILKAVKEICAPCSAREIQKVTGFEINVVSRAVNHCRQKQMIELYFTAKCILTGRRVNHYKVKET